MSVGGLSSVSLAEKVAAMEADRDRWIRLFNRLEKACSDAIERNPDDDALASAHRAVMREAQRPLDASRAKSPDGGTGR